MGTWWRVVRWLADATPGSPGHPAFVSARHQGAGRFDNPRHYTAGYVASTPQAAVGEVFADLPLWSDDMLQPGQPPGAIAALAAYKLAGRRLLDLDDPAVLAQYGVRPSDVLKRNRTATQELALRLHLESEYDGVVWWSYHRPEWTVAAVWRGHDAGAAPVSPFDPKEVTSIEELSMDHPAVVVAADVLRRVIRP